MGVGEPPERTDPGAPRIFQSGQPQGVPPLELTGERTLPDVPEENYWYRRHSIVYEWIGARDGGLSVVDLACGEGYGSAVLARSAADVVGVDANPDAHAHAEARYARPGLSFERTLIDSYEQPRDAVVFLQTIEHVTNPGEILDHCRGLVEQSANPAVYISTPNVLTLAPEGADRSGNPWHVHEYRPDEFRALCAGHFGELEIFGLHHARALRAHQIAIERFGWDSIHQRLKLTKPFYDRFVPAISERDFELVSERERSLDGALDLLAVMGP